VHAALLRYLAVVLAVGLCLVAWGGLVAEQAEEEEAPATYVGQKKCKMCHSDIFAAWEKTVHAHAIDSLDDEAKANKMCLSCHTTGYGEEGGFVDLESTPQMVNVQCEACHGAGSNYWNASVMKDRELAISKGLIIPPGPEVCVKCHNERSPEFTGFDYEEYVASPEGIHMIEKETGEEAQEEKKEKGK